MEVKKDANVHHSGQPTEKQLEAINAQAKAQLTKDQIYVFSLRLCDDQIDRDGERFDTDALPGLAKLFIGKTGVVDHRWSSDSQIARIFETQVVKEDTVHYIKAWAYIRRGKNADELIADIEAGIKKEVSVGCAMGRSVCSVCGSDYGTCGHQKGEYYDGALCCAILKEPMDAYEFSFVAVPAQREAGVLKGLGMGKKCLKDLADAYGAQGEYRELYQKAQLGCRYEKQLQEEVVRLCMILDLGVEREVLQKVFAKTASAELLTLKDSLEQKVSALLPGKTQLKSRQTQEQPMENGFLV